MKTAYALMAWPKELDYKSGYVIAVYLTMEAAQRKREKMGAEDRTWFGVQAVPLYDE